MRKTFLFVGLFFILTSCAKPSPEMIQTAIAETEISTNFTEQANSTPTPTNTATPTMTLTPTITHTPTVTLTPTETMEPALITATAVQATKDYEAEMKLRTATAVQATKDYEAKMKLRTATAVQATKDYVSDFGTIAWKELNNYPENHKSEKIKIRGKVFQIINAKDMLLWYPGTYDAFYVEFKDKYTGVYDGDTITIYGVIQGQYCYPTQSGGTNCVPIINGLWFEK